MSLQINCTDAGVINYPLHSHNDYEILYYLNGEGFLKTQNGDIPYLPGTIIIVPPHFSHGSTSSEVFPGFEETLEKITEPIPTEKTV